jgi:transcriptional regulator with XRE-family HTH domain
MAKYNDLKEYIQNTQMDMLKKEIQSFVDKHFTGSGFSSFQTVSVCRKRIDAPQVISMSCYDDLGPFVLIDVHLKATVVTMGLGSRSYDAYRQDKWFTVALRVLIKDGSFKADVLDVADYSGYTTRNMPILDPFLIPYIAAKDLEDLAEEFYECYCGSVDDMEGWRFPIEQVLEENEIQCFHAPLSDSEFGRMYFRESEVMVYESTSDGKRRLVQRTIAPNTILLSEKNHFMDWAFDGLDTTVHELVHFDKHQKFFELLTLLNGEKESLSCDTMPAIRPDGLNGLEQAYWWSEWQANALSSRICMPRSKFSPLLEQFYAEELSLNLKTKGEALEQALERVASVFGVSGQAAMVRALQLGYKQAEGTMIYRGAVFQPCFSFDPAALGDHETFRLNYSKYKSLYSSDPQFRSLIDDKAFVFTGAVVCINDEAYVKKSEDEFNYYGYELTKYALEHVDECCLKFRREFKTDDKSDGFYSLCYLSKDLDATSFLESVNVDYEDNQSVLDLQKNLVKMRKEAERVSKILDNLPSSFHGTLDAHMNRLKNSDGKKMTNFELSQRTGLADSYIRNLRHNHANPSPEVIYGICMGLHLHPEFSDDMVRKGCGGYPPTPEGFIAKDMLHKHYMDTLTTVNHRLEILGYPKWGGDGEISEVNLKNSNKTASVRSAV